MHIRGLWLPNNRSAGFPSGGGGGALEQERPGLHKGSTCELLPTAGFHNTGFVVLRLRRSSFMGIRVLLRLADMLTVAHINMYALLLEPGS